MLKWLVANWKMNGSLELVKDYENNLKNHSNLIVAPPFIYINKFSSTKTAAQNVHFQPNGAYTGEVSATQIKDIGVKFCIVGHSERRIYSLETNEIVKEKALRCIENSILPIICIGETQADYENKNTLNVLEKQLESCLPENGEFWIAYEPIWAIGTGLVPKLKEIEAIHEFIKEKTNKTILYGGSVNAENAEEILSIEKVDGVLVGGASLKIDAMKKMLNATAH